MKDFLNIFKVLKESIFFSGNMEKIRQVLESDTSFEESPKPNWTYQWLGKPFNGVIRKDQFLLIHVPFPATRYGTVIQGSLKQSSGEKNSIELKAWIDPRAKRKIILGYVISVVVISRLIGIRFLDAAPSDVDQILPFMLLATLPMSSLGTVLYSRSRRDAFHRAVLLLRSQS